MNKPLLKTLQGETIFPRPLWFMRQAGRYLPEYRTLREKAGSFWGVGLNPEYAVEVTLQPLRRFPEIDAAILFSDILVVPLALGYDVQFVKGEGPKLEKADVANLKPLGEKAFLRTLEPVFETLRRLRQALPSDKTLIGFAGAPWTLSTYMIHGSGSKDHAEVKAVAFKNPEAFDGLIDYLTQATLLYLKEQVKAGAEVLQLFDSWAGALPHPFYERWVVRPIQAIVKALKAEYPQVPLMVFPKGNPENYSHFFSCDGLSVESVANFSALDAAAPPSLVLQGALDPALLVAGGEEMFRASGTILRAFAGRPHIFNLGHGMTPQVPVQHVHDLIGFVKGWRP